MPVSFSVGGGSGLWLGPTPGGLLSTERYPPTCQFNPVRNVAPAEAGEAQIVAHLKRMAPWRTMMGWHQCEDLVLDGPASEEKGSKGRTSVVNIC